MARIVNIIKKICWFIIKVLSLWQVNPKKSNNNLNNQS